jgi:hypothetical protein
MRDIQHHSFLAEILSLNQPKDELNYLVLVGEE